MKSLLFLCCVLIVSCGRNQGQQTTEQPTQQSALQPGQQPSSATTEDENGMDKVKKAIEKALTNDELLKFFGTEAYLWADDLTKTRQQQSDLFKAKVENTLADKDKFEAALKKTSDKLKGASIIDGIDVNIDDFIASKSVPTNQLLQTRLKDGMSSAERDQLKSDFMNKYQPFFSIMYELFKNLETASG